MLKAKASKFIACAVAGAGAATMFALQSSAATPSSVSSATTAAPTKGTYTKATLQNATFGKVTAISGNTITLSTIAFKIPKKGNTSSGSSGSTDTTTGTATTETITVPDGCTIKELGSDSSTATLSDITVGSYIAVSYDSSGNVSSISIMNQTASKYRPVSGQVTAISGSTVTLSVPARGDKSSSGSTDTTTGTSTTETVTIPDGCTIKELGSGSSTATLSDIAVGSFITVSYDSTGNVSSVAIMNKNSETASKYRPVSGQVTAISGSTVTLSVSARGDKSSSGSTDTTTGTATTETVTIPDGCTIKELGSGSSTATLSDITVGSFIRVSYDSTGNVSSVAIMNKDSSTASKYRPVSGQVTAISGSDITLSVPARGSKKGTGSSGSTDTTTTAATTKTITVPAGCTITELSSGSSTGSAATLSDIAVGSHIRVSYDSNGNVSSIAILNLQKVSQ